MTDWPDEIAGLLERMRTRRPLVHHITNFVTMNDVANATLAIGASPVMAHAAEEVAEMARSANALCLNLGTPWPERLAAMHIAGRAANGAGVPVMLDPVGAGATSFRAESVRPLLDAVHVDIIRGNASEMAALTATRAAQRGVDVAESNAALATRSHVAQLAAQRGCVVAATGARDYISDGHRLVGVDNGHAWFARITGAGCMATAIIAAFAAVEPDALLSTTAALACYGLAGEKAATLSRGPGTFRAALFDALCALDSDEARAGVRVVELTSTA